MFATILKKWPKIDSTNIYMYVQTLKNILTNSTIDLGQEIRNNQGLAEYAFE